MEEKSRKVTSHGKQVEPWERTTEEGDRPWLAFRQYLKRRDHATVADRVGVSSRTIRNYASKYDWSERVAAWDAAQVRAEDDATKEKRADAALESIENWRAAEEKAFLALESLPVETIRDALAVADRATHWRRISMGEVTDRTEVREQLDLSPLTTEEVIEFRRLLRKAQGGQA